MGGTISFLYTGAFPERVIKLVLIEGVGPVGMNFSDAPLRMAQWIGEIRKRGRNHFREYTSVAAGADQLRQTNPRLQEALPLALAQAGMKQNDAGKWLWKFDPLHRTAAPQPFYTAQAIEFFRRIACPVLIVDGKQSHQTQAHRQTTTLRCHRQPATSGYRRCRPHGASGQSEGISGSTATVLAVMVANHNEFRWRLMPT